MYILINLGKKTISTQYLKTFTFQKITLVHTVHTDYDSAVYIRETR